MRSLTFLATDPGTRSCSLYCSNDRKYAARPATAGAAKSPHPVSSEVNDICIESGSPKEVPSASAIRSCPYAQKTAPGADTVSSDANP